MKITVRSGMLIALLLSMLAGAARADVGGKITGTVKDQTNAAIPGAAVTALNTTTGLKQLTKTDEQGRYSFPVLPVGPYEIDVTADGFDSLGRRHDIHDHERWNLAAAGCGLEEFQAVSPCRFKHRYLLPRLGPEHLPPTRWGCPRLAAFGGLLGHSWYRASRQSQKTA